MAKKKKSEREKYGDARRAAKLRGIPFLMAFEEWIGMWKASGHWEQRGWRRGQYVMARPGDKGPYEIGNVKICLAEENRAERNQNYPMTGEKHHRYGKHFWPGLNEETRAQFAAAQSARMKGRRKSLAHREKIRSANIEAARLRRFVIRNGRRGWSFPGDADYPVCNA